MGHEQSDKDKNLIPRKPNHSVVVENSTNFVLEKSIFSNVFEKDIRRVFIYKKAEQLAKAIHLIAPAFADAESLKRRLCEIAVALVDASTLPPAAARTTLSRELLALSSLLSIARTGGFLSPMNSDLIAREAQNLLQEVSAYEEPRILLEEAPSLSVLSRAMGPGTGSPREAVPRTRYEGPEKAIKDTNKGQIKDRQEAILSILKERGSVRIKDISTLIRGVSEKTIQRELALLIQKGAIRKEGERRWSTYFLTEKRTQ